MRHYSLAGTLAAIVLVSCLGCSATAGASDAGKDAGNKTGTATAAPTPAATATGRATARASAQAATAKKLTAQSADKELSAAVASVVKADDWHAAVAVDDLSTGDEASYNGNGEFATASIVKVDILSTLLYQLQKSGETLSDEQQDLATTMIENSDNDSASALYFDDGQDTGVNAANKVFGLTETTAGTDGEWGLTSTTVTDQVKLLQQVLTTDSVLSASSRDYVQGLMSEVEADQRWGVPAAADSGTSYMVKNGWLPNPTLWEINSIGEITHDGQKLLIAVMSSDNQTEDGGIDLVQQIAEDASGAVTK
ncbi:MAG TPA: serine hydrolase [Trebonia sp.]|jgi:beta-lactamase class A